MIEILTKQDLESTKYEILSEIRSLLKPSAGTTQKEWLKSNELRDLLKCSHGTIQNMRTRGTLKANKIGGIWYYPAKEVYSLLERGEIK